MRGNSSFPDGLIAIGLGLGVVHAGIAIENCLIDGNFAGTARGISDERTNVGELYVTNTTIRNNGAGGIVVIGTSRDVTLDNVRATNNTNGIVVSGGSKVMVNRSVSSGNSSFGISFDGATAEVNVSNSVSSNNGTGVQNNGGTPVIQLQQRHRLQHDGVRRSHPVLSQQQGHRKRRAGHGADRDRRDLEPHGSTVPLSRRNMTRSAAKSPS